MAAVADLLEGIASAVQELDQSPGLATIMRYTESISEQILRNPTYAQAMLRTLFQADLSSPIVEVLLDSSRRFVNKELYIAKREGELEEDVDLTASAAILSAHTWGVLLMWNKGLISLETLPAMCLRSMEMSILTIASEKGRNLLRTGYPFAAE